MIHAPTKYLESAEPLRPMLKRVFATTFFIWLTSRVIVFALLVLGPVLMTDPLRGLEQFERSILRAWDANWYFDIIEYGYDQFDRNQWSNRAFFPLYPWVVAFISNTFSLQSVWVGTIVSNFSFWIALAMLWRFCEIQGLKQESVRFAVLLLAFAPQGVVFAVLYAESLYLALGLASVVAMYGIYCGCAVCDVKAERLLTGWFCRSAVSAVIWDI
jgi:Gpi18-like mannosyltransferase